METKVIGTFAALSLIIVSIMCIGNSKLNKQAENIAYINNSINSICNKIPYKETVEVKNIKLELEKVNGYNNKSYSNFIEKAIDNLIDVEISINRLVSENSEFKDMEQTIEDIQKLKHYIYELNKK